MTFFVSKWTFFVSKWTFFVSKWRGRNAALPSWGSVRGSTFMGQCSRLYLHGAVFAALPSWGSTRSPRDHEPSFLIQQGVSLLIIEAKSNPLSTNSTVNAHTHYRQSGNSRQTTMHEAMHTNQHPFTAQRQHKIFPIHHLIEHKFTFLDLTKCILGLTFKS